MKTTALAIEHRLPQLFWVFVSISVLFASLYLYFVNKTVLQIVARKNVESQISALTTQISQLEGRYVELEQSVTREEASRLGLEQATKVTFLDPRISAKALSLRDGI